MIDIHSHIMPGIDDGPTNWEESIAILQAAINDGITGMVATSHVFDRLDAPLEKLYRHTFNELKERALTAGLSIDLWLACEFHCQTVINLTSPLLTLDGNGKYALIELPMAQIPMDFGDLIFNLELHGITPILAHPERNTVLMQKPNLAFDLALKGVLMQINAGSLMGYFGKRVQQVAELFLTHHLCHFVASDAHSSRSRPPHMAEAYRKVARLYGDEIAQNLFVKHPKAAIQGAPIHTVAPIEIKRDAGGLKNLFLKRFRG
ncbi:hypothetical protein KAR48_09435 [bacterium]|nr:hypothetical protein [bacterium]